MTMTKLGTLIFALLLASAPASAQTIVQVNSLAAATALAGSELFPIYQGALPLVTTTPLAITSYVAANWPSQSANRVFAAPNGSSGVPGFRALVGADLPAPGASSLGGVESIACASHQWLNTISTGGAPACAQPGFSDLSGSLSSGQLPSLTAAEFWLGNGSNVATAVALSGDCSISNSGAITCTKTSGTAFGTAATANTGTSGATVPLLNGTNAWSGPQTFGEVLGTVTTQSGTTYTFAATDCGTEVTFSNGSAVTATIPATLPAACNIAVAQLGAGSVSVNGSAVTPATLHSAHSFTKTSAQYAVIDINIEANSGGSSAIALLTGDGS